MVWIESYRYLNMNFSDSQKIVICESKNTFFLEEMQQVDFHT